MQEIELYYTNSLKYLKCGKYQKYFQNESIDDMLACIKNQDTPVRIRANRENIVKHKLSDKSRVIYTYEELKEEEIFDYSSVERDYDSEVSYAKYSVAKNWQKLLGNEVYFCRERNMQLYLVKTYKRLCFLFTDLIEVKNGLLKNGEIPDDVTTRMYLTDEDISKGSPTVENLLIQRIFDGKEIEECENDIRR